MASDIGEEENRTPRLPLLPHIASPERPNMPASPIRSLASVPFSWEEEPGKPKRGSTPPSADVSSLNCTKTLELPPRLLLERDSKRVSKQPSPTAVLDGPYSMGRSNRFDSPSFRTMVMAVGGDCYGSFRSETGSLDYAQAVEEDGNRGKSNALVVRRNGGPRGGTLGFVGLWKKGALKGKREVGRGSYVFPSSVDKESECNKEGEENIGPKIMEISEAESLSSLSASKSRFWGNVYQGLKQVVPWKKSKKIRA